MDDNPKIFTTVLLGIRDTKSLSMKKLFFTLVVFVSSISSYAQHTWDFTAEVLKLKDYQTVQLVEGKLSCRCYGRYNYQSYPRTTDWLSNIYFWGRSAISSMLGTNGLSADGFIEIPGYDANTDSLVITYLGWNGSSYDAYMTKTMTPFDDYVNTPQNLFFVNSSAPFMIIRYIDWYRNGQLITDPASVTSAVSNVRVPEKTNDDTYNIEGIKVPEATKGLVIKGGKKIIQK